MMRSGTFDASLVSAECPLRDKLFAGILEDSPGVLAVTLLVPLDPASPGEDVAIKRFAPRHTLEVEYRVEMNFDAERNQLAQRFHAMYRKHPVRAALRAPTLAPVPDEALRDALVPVAAQGASIFRRLFQPGRFDSHPDDDAHIIRDALRSALNREMILVLKSPVLLFPWAFLYDDPAFDELDLRTLDMGRFWGFRHQIQEAVGGVAPGVCIPGSPKVVAAVCSTVDPNAQHRNGPLGQLPADRMAWLTSALALADKLRAFDADCLYFFGHAAHDDPPTPTTSYLKIEGVELTVERVARTGGPRFLKPLVLAFLNGCCTTPLNTWNGDSFAGFLCIKGDRRVACITSFAEVPTAFSAALGQHFWESFLAGQTLGEALLSARRDLLTTYNNPLGLLYTVFGRVETRIVP